MRSPHDFDVIIAGGGLTGASLALALSADVDRIALIEAVPPASGRQPSYDDRGLALSISSRRILQGLDVWAGVHAAATPVEHLHISNQYHCGVVRLHARELGLPALGYIVLARLLGTALMQKVLTTPTIEFICPARAKEVSVGPDHAEVAVDREGREQVITGRLLVVADGASSPLREKLGITSVRKDYHQTAIVTNVRPDKAHNNTAWERFTPVGPLALLPLPDNRCSLVFTVAAHDAKRYLAMDEHEFLSCLQSRFSARLGKFRQAGERASYALQFLQAVQQVRERVVLLGNAAHTLHPNGAQGFNLCLRDVAGLAETLHPVLRAGGDPGSLPMLQKYQECRSDDQARVTCFTDGLASLFYSELPHKVMCRNLGMLLLNLCPPGRRLFARMGTGLWGRQPALVRGTP